MKAFLASKLFVKCHIMIDTTRRQEYPMLPPNDGFSKNLKST